MSRRGPELTKESISAQVCAQAKSQKGFKGTSLHNIMSDQQPHPSAAKSWSRCRSTLQYGVSQCFNVDCIPGKWSGAAMQHAVEKTFLVAQPVQPVALTSQVACYQSTVNKWRPESTKACREWCEKTPPRSEVSSAPFGTQRYQNSKQSGVSSRSMKRCTIAKGDRLHARPV